jgi:hypothetical protein
VSGIATTVQSKIRREVQIGPVADEVLALTAIVRPILSGILFALKYAIVDELGGHAKISLNMLSRVYNQGDGDCGICFEYAVHEALNVQDPKVLERVSDAIKLCRVPGRITKSILFGAEKTGALNLIDTASNVLTDESRVLTGMQAQPPLLKRHLRMLAAAFRRPVTRIYLPYSISGLWKADLFIGCTDSDRWVGTTVKINADRLEGAQGLRIGIVPAQHGKTDRVRKDDSKNLVTCLLLHDGNFMQSFYEAWQIVQSVMATKMTMPSEAQLPRPAHRHVARLLIDRAAFPTLEVIDALRIFSQPSLLSTDEKIVAVAPLDGTGDDKQINMLVAPMPRDVSN